jgi:UDP-3-O-[3-hydroxymyristoyl] glucosamine N-acyltransferase
MPKVSPTPEIPVARIAELVKGTVIGNSALVLRALSPLDNGSADSLAFCTDKSHISLGRSLKSTSAGAVFVSESFANSLPDVSPTLIVVKDPLHAFIESVPLFHTNDLPSGDIHETAIIHPTAKIGKGVTIAPYSVIGEHSVVEDDVAIGSHVAIYPRCVIGTRTTIHAHVVIREDSRIGADSIIHSGTVVGSDGFGYHFVPGKGLLLVPQIGNVEVGSKVEIGANSCIDKGTLGSTVVGSGSKIDNLVQVGHNCMLGESVILCGQAGLAGSTTLGAGVVIGGQSGVAGHLSIAAGARVAGASAVLSSLEEKGDYAGIPAMPAKTWRRQLISLARLIRPKTS